VPNHQAMKTYGEWSKPSHHLIFGTR